MKKALATFWWMQADQEAFLTYLDRFAPLVAFTGPWKTLRDEVRPIEFRAAISDPAGGSFLFGRADQFSDSQIVEHVFPTSGRKFSVTADFSNVMWWSRSARPDGKVTLCTIGFYPEQFDPSTCASRPKDEGFQEWARSVLRWVRNRTPEKEGFYRASPLLRTAKESGAVQLAAY